MGYVVPASALSAEERSELWWQSDDYDQFLGTARLISTEIQRRSYVATVGNSYPTSADVGYGAGLGIVDVKPLPNPEGYANVMSATLEACCTDLDPDQADAILAGISRSRGRSTSSPMRPRPMRSSMPRWRHSKREGMKA